jgi:hypothetical protein
MARGLDVDDIILNYDPASPHRRFRDMGLSDEIVAPAAALPKSVPWPVGREPKAAPLAHPPAETDSLSRVHGWDALVVTWTVAEASAMAAMFTPGHLISDWYEYRHDLAAYDPLVTGKKAPFNDHTADMARYYRSLGLYFPCAIGDRKVLLFKSGLHLDYDGPAFPVRKLIAEIAHAVKPKVFITTGTAGGIGADVRLGDVVVAGAVRFDCKQQFKGEPWASAIYEPSPLSADAQAAMTPDLMGVNAQRIPGARATPKIFASRRDAIVTTDFFAFDDSTSHYRLEGLGRACDMGDAMVGNALHAIEGMKWHAVRNASDPQIANPSGNISEAAEQAAVIYMKYGGLTTAASLIASWAIIQDGPHDKAFNEGPAISAGFKLGRLPPETKPK